jgi:coenzyme F420-reducing hydrogenase delta subunit
MTEKTEGEFSPKILVFSTNSISDPGIDLAGLLKMHYPPSAYTVSIPCSSSINPDWIIYAFKKGFDGVFIAADGTDCPYRDDCSELTAKIVQSAQTKVKELGINPARIKMAAICSVCAEPFVNHMKKFSEALIKMGSIKNESGGKDVSS